MKITYDKVANALYLYVQKGKISKTVPISENLIIDLDKEDQVVGIEMLGISSKKGALNIQKLLKMGVSVELISGTGALI